MCRLLDQTVARGAVLGTLLLISTVAHAFDSQGHRGARGLAPENTLAAFDTALAIGVDTLELDIGITADGVPVIAHDPHLPPDMARNAQGEWLVPPTPPLRGLTLAQVQAHDLGRARPGSTTHKNFPEQGARDGERMPTLAALFARVKALGADTVRFNIETKLDPRQPDDTAPPEVFVQRLLDTVAAAGMQGRLSIQSFDWRTLRLVQQRAPDIPTVYLTLKNASTDNAADPAWTAGLRRGDYASVPHMVKAAGGAVWSPNQGSLDEDAVRTAHALGLKVIPWTVNQPADMQRLIGWGVDGLITDYPDRLRAVLAARGMALPAPVALPPR